MTNGIGGRVGRMERAVQAVRCSEEHVRLLMGDAAEPGPCARCARLLDIVRVVIETVPDRVQ